ncbi:hypothetical protein M8J77_007427 [Diaphorina citri]|nr:hypothetical protein M8J77_007427 [Diaphorina citri]
MSSKEETVETKPNKKSKKKQSQGNPDDSIQIIDEISNTNPTICSVVDTSVEIISEYSVKSTNSNKATDSTNLKEQTQSESTESQPIEIVEPDSVDNCSKNPTGPQEKPADFISFSNEPENKAHSKKSKNKKSIKSHSSNKEDNDGDLNDLFQIDTSPSDSHDVVPHYVSKFSESALLEEQVPAKKSWRPTALCFNCNGEHSMRDCDQPRNQRNINRNRNIFMEKKMLQTGNLGASRYHLDHHQRFAHLKPGVISKRLRKALNISHDQLPLHLYRMRLVGYPPAWLEEAKVKHSGITVFDSSGQALADPEDEDGEIEVDRCKYDMKKIIEFPGFNVRPPKGTLNESEYLGFPDMIPEQHKDRMISYLSPHAAVPYKKRKLNDKDLPLGTEDHNTTGGGVRNSTDMEIDDVPETRFEPAGECAFIPALPDDPLPPLPPPPPSPLPPPPPGTEDEEQEEGEISDDSEEEKKGVKRKREEEQEERGSNKKSKPPPPSLPSTSSSLPSTSTPPPTLSKTASTPNLGSIKTIDLGTPIIDHAVSFDRLPSQEAFSKNICDVLNFDNLPDSTGKYKILSKVVKKVRNFMTKLTKS